MANLIIVERDIRETPAQFTVELSDDLKEIVDQKVHGRTYKWLHNFHASSLKGHLLLTERVNGEKADWPFDLAHEIPEAEKILENKAMDYARELKGIVERQTDTVAEIRQKIYPYEGWTG